MPHFVTLLYSPVISVKKISVKARPQRERACSAIKEAVSNIFMSPGKFKFFTGVSLPVAETSHYWTLQYYYYSNMVQLVITVGWLV